MIAKTRRPKITYLQYGGKESIAPWIVEHFPAHRVYAEPFCGSCAVLFAKPQSFVEIANDIESRIINMFRQIRSYPRELAALLWATPYAADNWREARCSPDELEDARLLMAEGKQFYCGNRRTSTWSIDKSPAPHKPKQHVWADWFLRVLPAAARLKDVVLTSEDGVKCIERVYDCPEALLYVDPPYLGHENEYEHAVDYAKMAEVLAAAKAKVVVSEYPTAAELFGGWRRVERATAGRARCGAHRCKAKVNTEVLYLNF